MPAEENNPADCFRRRGQGASRREGIRQYAEKIPCSPPKMKKLYRKVWLFLFYLQGIRTRREQALPAEENSPADCFRRRGQGASRREGIRQYAEKIPCSPPKMKKLYRKVWLFIFLFARDSNKEGAGSSSEENSPADCFRRRGQGASRREGIRQYAEKIPCSPHSLIAKFCLLFCFNF